MEEKEPETRELEQVQVACVQACELMKRKVFATIAQFNSTHFVSQQQQLQHTQTSMNFFNARKQTNNTEQTNNNKKYYYNTV